MQVANGLVLVVALREVVGEGARVLVEPVRVQPLDRLSHEPVQSPPALGEEALRGHLLR